MTIGNGAGTDELRLPADFHALEPFRPAWNHAVERKFRRLIAFIGTVELGSINEHAAVIYFHGVGGAGGFAGAWSEFPINEAA